MKTLYPSSLNLGQLLPPLFIFLLIIESFFMLLNQLFILTKTRILMQKMLRVWRTTMNLFFFLLHIFS